MLLFIVEDFGFDYEASHMMTISLMTVMLSIDILFTEFSQLVRVGPIHSYFDLGSEFNPTSVLVASYIRGQELFVGERFYQGISRACALHAHCVFIVCATETSSTTLVCIVHTWVHS